mmetsp:Transcript_78585/g.230556  ORF Transcript_78585/g.230556 Transcript_78585/m.230556 type:complete len:777 (+) Transcript_78585:71-2401(+)
MASLAASAAALATNVRVVCRVRPMDEREKKAGTVPAASASTERKEVALVRKVGGARQVRSSFHFDEVLASFSTQEDVFAATLQPLVGQVLAGYEATAFAYGQTGTGKTYTMEGEADSEERRGLMPRAVAAVLDALKGKEYVDHSVTVSYLEIYNEELSDLLSPTHGQQKLQLMDSCDSRGICCVGLSEVPVTTLADVLDLVKTAQERKRIAETRINARSSRSHCIFTMKVSCRRKVAVGELENCGKLHLIDLAGSECAKKAAWSTDEPGSKPALEQERERRNINQSLLTLGRVIAALRERTGRVPYRDSKLTRLLRDALGGSCKTVIIATISPALSAVDETSSTLTYAEQAAGIRNRPVASSLLRSRSGEVGGASSGSCSGGAGVSSTEWAEMEMKVAYLQQEVEEAQTALARKYQENQEWMDRAEKAEAELDEVRAALKESEAERGLLAEASHAVAQELGSTAGELAAARDALARELAELSNQRSSEEKVLELLKGQREALEAETLRAQGLLGAARQDLEAARAEVMSLKTAQDQAREQAVQEIANFARSQLAAVGQGLERSAAALCGLADGAHGAAGAAGEAFSLAAVSTVTTGSEVERAANEWSKGVAARCDAAGREAAEASEAAERRLAAAAERLSKLCPGAGERRLGGEAPAPDQAEDAQAAIYEDKPTNPQPSPETKHKAKAAPSAGAGAAMEATAPAVAQPAAWNAPGAKENCPAPRVATPRGGVHSARRPEQKLSSAGPQGHEKAGGKLARAASGELQGARAALREVN